ncbi:hypothetical protein K438DRAFT_1817804 [Mycena galopus ATCC 62051]|nr:hypothetical protein K438DRAFT_1817804 [Mycena galopus ATCC 62051]
MHRISRPTASCTPTPFFPHLGPTAAKEDLTFPPELFDLIFDHCDLKTRRACALVSSSFRGHARVSSHVRVDPLNEGHSAAKFHKFLEDSPSFAAGIKSLHLSERLHLANKETESGKLLTLLVSLKRLHISTTVIWDDTDPLSESIRLALTRPNLTHLELTNIPYLSIHLLAHFPALRSLTLDRIYFKFNTGHDFEAAATACVGSCPARLEHLSCAINARSFDLLVRWILLPQSPLDISRLRSLVCRVDRPCDEVGIQRLLRASAPSLRSLRLESCENFSKATTLDLNQLARLHTLSMEIYVDTITPAQNVRLLSLGNIIFPPLQQALAIDFTLYTNHGLRAVIELLADADHALAALPFIASVTVTWLRQEIPFEQPRDKREKPQDVTAAFVQEMSLLVKRLAGQGSLLVLQSRWVPDGWQ